MSVLILCACVGFIVAVMWVDLIFDALVLPHHNSREPLPEEVLATMSSFFKRITYKPFLIFVILVVMLVVIIQQIISGSVPGWAAWASLVLILVSVGFAVARVIPTARRLGSRADTLEKQSELARSLLPMHAFVLIAMLLVLAVQVYVSAV